MDIMDIFDGFNETELQTISNFLNRLLGKAKSQREKRELKAKNEFSILKKKSACNSG